jgi:hypothetical protein
MHIDFPDTTGLVGAFWESCLRCRAHTVWERRNSIARFAKRKASNASWSWVFQPSLIIQSSSADVAIFLPRGLEPALTHSDRDRESNRLLFRGRREFAIGHGCAAEWKEAKAHDRAVEVRTELIPEYELRKVEPRTISSPYLETSTLASVQTAKELHTLLMPLIDDYAEWIKKKNGTVDDLAADLKSVALSHLEDCTTALGRMKRGIELLVQDATSASRPQTSLSRNT